MADRLVVLNAGHIEQVGTPIDLYERPASTFVATFIGSPSMNLLPDGAGQSWTPGNGLKAHGSQFTLGIRPEDISVLKPGETASGFSADVRVEAVELVGAESYIHSRLSDGHGLVFRTAGRSVSAIDDTVRIGAAADKVHLFDAKGIRI